MTLIKFQINFIAKNTKKCNRKKIVRNRPVPDVSSFGKSVIPEMLNYVHFLKTWVDWNYEPKSSEWCYSQHDEPEHFKTDAAQQLFHTHRMYKHAQLVCTHMLIIYIFEIWPDRPPYKIHGFSSPVGPLFEPNFLVPVNSPRFDLVEPETVLCRIVSELRRFLEVD